MGPRHERLCGLDVVDAYMGALTDELDCEGIRHATMPTRTAPGVLASKRWAQVEPNTLVVHCLAGFRKKGVTGAANQTEISYGGKHSYGLADDMADAVGQWGQCYVHGHKTGNPRFLEADKLLNLPETKAIAIEPFWINGPDVQEYMARAEKLGEVIARCLADHLTSRGHAQIYPVPPVQLPKPL